MPSSAVTPKKSRFQRDPAKKAQRSEQFAQVRTVFSTARAQDPKLPLYLAAAFLAVFLVFLLLGLWWGHPFILGFFGLLFGLLAAVVLFGRLAQRAAFGQIEGQPGATGAALSAIRRGWYVQEEPVAAEAGRARKASEISQAAMVFRAVGKPGVVLIAEGPSGAARKLLEAERKRVARVVGPEVPVHLLRTGSGNDDDTVRVSDLAKRMNRLDKVLTDSEMAQVNKRLRALGAQRPPIPKGTDPRGGNARIDRRAMRGR